MAIKTFTTGEVLTASDTNTYLANSGLVTVKPSSVAGTGVSLSGATVNFSSANPVSINGCFNATYDNYRVLVRIYGTGSSFSTFRLRAAGVDEAGLYYFRTGFYTQYSSAAVNGYSAGPLTSSLVGQYGTSISDTGTAVLEFCNPALAAYKTTFYQDCLDPATATRYTTNGTHAVTASYDGFSVIPNAGSITGQIMIYGYRKG